MVALRAGVSRIPVPGRLLLVLVAAALTVTGATLWTTRDATVRVTAYFTNSVGLYSGDRVVLRGVPIGGVDEVTPVGDRVRVAMHFDSSHPVSADTRAVIVAPTLVSGRYVQLIPKRDDEPELRDGAVIPLERTAVPVEYDEIKRQVTELATQLGPMADDPSGSLARFVDVTAHTLGGNGATLKDTLVNLSKAMRTLSEGGPDLFATVRNLQLVVSALAANDEQVRIFAGQLAGVSNRLNSNRTQLDAALHAIRAMLPEIRDIVAENRDALNHDVSSLTRITSLLVDRQDDLAQVLHFAPTVISDLYNIYDPASKSATANLNLPDFPDPMSLICALLTTVDAPQAECSRASAQFGDLFGAAVRAAMGGSSAPSPLATEGMPGLPSLPAIPGLTDLLTPGAGR
ncbi:MCE family protein [Nocardia exalbida]|uniref:MCE family protein n=1 Tax=Nocardia exalbida TaxID=290231 RepID=UPI000305A37D|nr:MCE family protein [Nocardia exalbida]